VNNGDGTITCTFDHLCVISFSVVGEAPQEPASFPWYWILILLIAVVILIVIIKKSKKKEEKVAN
jgi:4-hydroxybenzoate polyprenyltransferase